MLKTLLVTLLLLCNSYISFTQYDTTHYIAPSRWKYVNDRHEVVFSTLSTSPVQVEIRLSDGTLIDTESVVKGAPTRYTFPGTATTNQRNVVNTVFSNEGIIITAVEPVSVNIRNVNGDTNDAILKGNTSLTSKGVLALGERFHLIYYRDYGAFYGMLAIEDNTIITKNGVALVTLNAGESYVIGGGSVNAALGDLIEANKPISMTSSFDADNPGSCADPIADQLIPNQLAGEEYIVVRGQGNANLSIELTTVMATEPNTNVFLNGVLNTTLAQAGDYVTVSNGINPYDVNLIESDKPVLLAQGAGQGCEHGMSIIPPLKCTGSRHIETKDFHNLDYSVFLLSKCNTVAPTLNGIELTGGEPITNSNWTLFQFDNNDVSIEDIILDSETPMHVGILQDGGAFGGFAYFSGFSKTGIDLTATTSSGDSTIIEGCTTAEYIFTRESFCDETDTVLINVTGSATEGLDYFSLPDTLFFTPGTDTLVLSIESIVDDIEEGIEELQIFVVADKNCDGILDTTSSTLYIEDYTEMTLSLDRSDAEICVDNNCSSTSETVEVTATVMNGIPPYYFSWSDGFSQAIPNLPYQLLHEFSELNGNVPEINETFSLTVYDACNNEVNSYFELDNICPMCAPNVITPNGDNVNDFFIIKNIEQYPEAKLSILNRWGNVVFEQGNYQNDWSGSNLTGGVYFYIVTIEDDVEIHGFFHIIRK